MTRSGNPVARKLYLRIWLAVAGSVAVLSLLVGWAWHAAEQQRERERQPAPPREVVVRDAAGAVIGSAEAQPRRMPGQGLEFVVSLQDGQVLHLQMPPRGRGGVGGPVGGPRRELHLAWLRPPYGFVWMLGLAGLVVMIGVFPVARRLTQRLEALQRGVQRWGGGDLSVRLPEGGQDEVADLSRHFNAAAERVQHLMDSQAALLQSQKSLLANASHELRSPLARIRMALEMLPPRSTAAPVERPPEGAACRFGSGPAAARPADGASEEIARNIAELDQLIDEILLASRLDAREADMGTVEPVDLTGLLAEECARVGAALAVADGAGEMLVPGVARLLRRVVRNLLENAVRHGRRTGRAGEVSAELAPDGAWAVLHVDDRGPGVPSDQCERIFEPFYRLPGASEREGGVGLGLSLVRSIVERHGGSVSCANREGGGARFTVRLPLA